MKINYEPNIYVVKDQQGKVRGIYGKPKDFPVMVGLERTSMERPKNSEVMESMKRVLEAE